MPRHFAKPYFTGIWPGVTPPSAGHQRAAALRAALLKKQREAAVNATLTGNQESAAIAREAQVNLNLLKQAEHDLGIER